MLNSGVIERPDITYLWEQYGQYDYRLYYISSDGDGLATLGHYRTLGEIQKFIKEVEEPDAAL